MKLITLHLPEPYIQALDNLVDEKYYPNRAEAIRTAVRDLLTIEAWGKSRKWLDQSKNSSKSSIQGNFQK